MADDVPEKPRDFYSRRAKHIIRMERESRELSYEQLFERMREHGWTASEAQVLITKVNRGTFTFAFALQMLAAMGVKSIDIPDYYVHHPKATRPKKREPGPPTDT